MFASARVLPTSVSSSTGKRSEAVKVSDGAHLSGSNFILEIRRRLRENEPMAGKLSKSTNEGAYKALSK
jgi:hypothetical protein